MTHLAEQVERIETELAELRVRVAKMRAFGQQLANCAYNLKQSGSQLDDHAKQCLNVAQVGWDEAVRGMP